MVAPNDTDANKLISDRGPAQPAGFAEDGKQGSNKLDDQHPATPESIAEQDALKDTVSNATANTKTQP